MVNKFILVYLTIQIIIFIHELGHFFFAYIFKYTISEISLGFGRTIYSKSINHLKFNIRLLPLGGFVCINELGHMDRWGTATIIYLGGVIFNILFALICIIFVFNIGITSSKPFVTDKDNHIKMITYINNNHVTNWMNINELALLAFLNSSKLTLTFNDKSKSTFNTSHFESFFENTWLNEHGYRIWEPTLPPKILFSNNEKLEEGDIVLKVNTRYVKNNDDLKKIIQYNPNKPLIMKIIRDNKLINVEIMPKKSRSFDFITLGYLDIKLSQQKWPTDHITNTQFTFIKSLTQSIKFVFNKIYLQYLIILKLLTGVLTLDMLSGPIGIYSSIYQSFDYGIVGYLYTLSLLSIAVAMINLIPIPPTDGFYIIVKTFESLTSLKISKRYLLLFQHITLIFIFLVVVNVSLNEIKKFLISWQKEVTKYEI